MNYIELRVFCIPEFRDILIAELGEFGFESMMETDAGFNAYTESSSYDPESLTFLEKKYGVKAQLKFESKKIPKENWNKKWEKNFDPVIIAGTLAIRASFHKPIDGVSLEIIIDPKMSFGTGHHETTSLMAGMQLKIDHKDKRVLDCGCGTGILSILAKKLKADIVKGIDLDPWAVTNSKENAKLNQAGSILFLESNIGDLEASEKFDILLANINKNVLIAEIGTYNKFLNPGGYLLLSGFYTSDLDDIIEESSKNNLECQQSEVMNNWVGATFIKRLTYP